MRIVLVEDQLMFRDSPKRFANERAPVSQLRTLRDSNDPVGFKREVWKEMAEMGWAGVLVPEEFGGVGFGYVGAGRGCALAHLGQGQTLYDGDLFGCERPVHRDLSPSRGDPAVRARRQ